jgi:hypothetical protein
MLDRYKAVDSLLGGIRLLPRTWNRDKTNIQMDNDRVNALLIFVGGLLAFSATVFPIVKSMLAKAAEKARQEQIREMVLAFIALGFLLFGLAWYRWFSPHWVCIAFFFCYTVAAVGRFLIKRATPTRSEIIAEAVLPVFMFMFMLFWIYIDPILARLTHP